MQVYQSRNHTKENDEQNVKANKTETEQKPEESENKNKSGLVNSAERQSKENIQEDEIFEGEDKKIKIKKIKAGLKLNIKKFSLQVNEPTEKQEEKKVPETKKVELDDKIKKFECSIKKDEVLEILKYFCQNIQNHSEMIVCEVQKKQKNNQTQIGALINKLLMIFSNSIEWSEDSESSSIAEKQKFIDDVEKMFPYFNFIQICKNYSVTLATTKHPNASAKQKTNPELTFTTEFFKIYNSKQQEVPVNQNKQKNLQLSDSDFKSDEEEIHAVKCSIEDFKKFTGFNIENKSPVKVEPEVSKVSELTSNHQTQEKLESQKKQLPKEQLKEHEQIEEQKTQKKMEKVKPQEKPKVDQKEDKKKEEDKKGKEEVKKQKKVPLEFYIKHQIILV